MKKWIILILRLFVLTGCVIFLVFKVDFNDLYNNVLKKLPVWILAISILISLFRTWLNGVRWKIVNTDFSGQLSNWDYFRYMMISSSFSLIAPGALGGDIVKAFWVGNDIVSNKTRNILSIFFDRAIGFLSLFILSLFAFSFSAFFNINIKIIIWSIAFILLILLFLFIRYLRKDSIGHLIDLWQPKRNIFSKMKNILAIFRNIVIFYLDKPLIFVYALLISFVIHISFFAMNYLIAAFLNIKISFLDISMVSCLVWFITVIPVSISGIGVREISYISLMGLYGISAEASAGLSLYGFLVMVIVGLLGLPFVFTSRRKK